MLQAKKEIYDIKQQRLYLAQDEYNHLNNVLSTLNTSRTSCKYNRFRRLSSDRELMWFLLAHTVINSNYIVSYVAEHWDQICSGTALFYGPIGTSLPS